jgi:hypothetical protein
LRLGQDCWCLCCESIVAPWLAQVPRYLPGYPSSRFFFSFHLIITPHYISSHDISSHDISSHDISSHLIALPSFRLHRIESHRIASLITASLISLHIYSRLFTLCACCSTGLSPPPMPYVVVSTSTSMPNAIYPCGSPCEIKKIMYLC